MRSSFALLRMTVRRLEGYADAELGGEGNAYGGARTEEISQSAFGYFELLQAGDRRGLGAVCNRANAGDIGDTLSLIHI